MKTVCNKLGSVKVKSHEIGVMLGIPQHKLLEFQKGDNPLPAIADSGYMAMLKKLKFPGSR